MVRAQGSDDATFTDPRASLLCDLALLGPGAVLAGRYRIERFIAAGGMGEVHQAIDTLLDERIAVKLLREDLSKKPTAHERFAQEIRLARRVTHRNVCRVFDVGVDGARVFFTMELHAGATLSWHLARTGPLDVAAASPLMVQILDGVAAAHAAGVVHADLKPSNILLTGTDAHRVVVTDFGLAMPCCADLSCHCGSAHLFGTPAYMAPEQVTGGTLLDTTDVFALARRSRLPEEGRSPDDLRVKRLPRVRCGSALTEPALSSIEEVLRTRSLRRRNDGRRGRRRDADVHLRVRDRGIGDGARGGDGGSAAARGERQHAARRPR
jgi:serine/threonine protein kinase